MKFYIIQLVVVCNNIQFPYFRLVTIKNNLGYQAQSLPFFTSGFVFFGTFLTVNK